MFIVVRQVEEFQNVLKCLEVQIKFPMTTNCFAILSRGYCQNKKKKKISETLFIKQNECVPLRISYHLHFLRVSTSKLDHGSLGPVQNKECYSLFAYTFWHFVLLFIKKLCFCYFHFFFYEVLSFKHTILKLH